MTWAGDLWLSSLLLAAIALAIMSGLVLGRLAGRLLTTGRAKRRQQWLSLFLGGSGDPPAGPAFAGRSQLADLSTELIQMVRGSDRDIFVDRAQRLEVPALLRHRLDSGSARVRLAAAEALAQFPDTRTVERLTAALDDANAEVRLSAALALASTGNAPAARSLISKLGIGTRENSRLVVTLFRDVARARPDQVRDLIGSADIPSGAKAAAIEAMSASGDYNLVPVIAELVLASPDGAPELPRYLRALADFGHPAAEPAIRLALSSKSWETRAAAARAAGTIGLAGLTGEVARLLADPEWWVRFRAGEALVRFGAPGRLCLRQAVLAEKGPAAEAARLTLAERGLA